MIQINFSNTTNNYRLIKLYLFAIILSVNIHCQKNHSSDENTKLGIIQYMRNATLTVSAPSNVTTSSYSIGGTVSGLISTGLVLQNNGTDDLSISSGLTSFTFVTKVNGAYAVSIKTQPTGLSCTFANASGTATANITNISLTCISDGSSWTSRTMPSSATWKAITYANGKFVAIAGGGSNSDVTATSPDGINWTLGTMPQLQKWISITSGNGLFVAVAGGGVATNVAATSTDGITWTMRALPSINGWQSVTFGNGLFVAVSSSNSAAAYSSDGINWTAATLPSNTSWNCVTYGNGMFVTVASSGTNAATSTDGINWTARTLPASGWWQSVIYGNGVFVAVIASPGTVAASSTDGINWTARTLPSSVAYSSTAY